MTAWRNLGVVETIYEEESEYSTSSSPSLSSPSTPLHSRVEAWSVAVGLKPDVLIHVQGACFHLHRDPMSTRSNHLKRHLTNLSELTLSPPLNITPETFSLVAYFCYGTHIAITPFNVAALRVAAELLQMTDTNNVDGDDNLKQMTEAYFCRFVAVNQEYALIVFRSCLTLLPEAETTVSLLGRCIEALSLTEYGDGIDSFVKDVTTLRAEDFKIVAESMHRRLSCHDLLYRIVDIYIKEENGGKIAEEQKTQICNSIDCSKLSPDFLIHAVQNPRMPLRFIVQAMLADQLNTRLSLFSANNNHHQPRHHGPTRDPLTLGAILQRDSALRQAAQLKSAMNATTSRIHNLEKELNTMKKLLQESEKQRSSLLIGSRSVLDSGRSASFHCVTTHNNSKIERGEKGSSSSLSLRFSNGRSAERGVMVSSSSDGSTWNDQIDQSPRVKKNIGQKLIKGLKSAFLVFKHSSNKEVAISKLDDDDIYGGYEDFNAIKDDIPPYLLKSGSEV